MLNTSVKIGLKRLIGATLVVLAVVEAHSYLLFFLGVALIGWTADIQREWSETARGRMR